MHKEATLLMWHTNIVVATGGKPLSAADLNTVLRRQRRHRYIFRCAVSHSLGVVMSSCRQPLPACRYVGVSTCHIFVAVSGMWHTNIVAVTSLICRRSNTFLSATGSDVSRATATCYFGCRGFFCGEVRFSWGFS